MLGGSPHGRLALSYTPWKPIPMETSTLLQELDSRQNEVMARLDELNRQIEDAIKAWSDVREDSLVDQSS